MKTNAANQLHSSSAKIGNVAHALTLVSTSLFCVTVVTGFSAGSGGPLGIISKHLDEEWKANGFCVANIDVPYWNSHDACLYVDTALSLVLFVAYFVLGRNNASMESANAYIRSGIPGIVAHGIGHGAIAARIRDGGLNDDRDYHRTGLEIVRTEFEEKGTSHTFMQALPFVFFWFGLMKGSLPNIKSWKKIAVISIAVNLVQLFVPEIFGFTFVQTVLMISFSADQLLMPSDKKADFAYAWYPVLVGLPLTLVGWMESTQCSKFVMQYLYGHLAYDAFIPLAMLIWYLMIYHLKVRGGAEKEKAA